MPNFEVHPIFYLAVEPIHVGAGGYRLGRVDMTIAREPGTNLPKIPGTSLAGAARSYAAMLYGKPWAAGQHTKVPLALKKNCPIMYTFGTTSDNGDSGQAGAVSFGDARILLFPVYSRLGPLWVTTRELLESVGVKGIPAVPTEGILTTIQKDQGPAPAGQGPGLPLNLGFLAFQEVSWALEVDVANLSLPAEIAGRIVVVASQHFGHIVNSNLEVRTSVSIDPERGAAADGALFTYEAIPRGTVVFHEVVVDDYQLIHGKSIHIEKKFKGGIQKIDNKDVLQGEDNAGDPIGPWKSPIEVAKAGLRLMHQLGVGGMGTRGFGRLQMLEGSAQ
jgi:CRISPR-associated protein Cmr4